MNVLVLGASGMLGCRVYHELSRQSELEVYGSIRSSALIDCFKEHADGLISGIDVLSETDLLSVFEKVNPDVVINCVGLIKQLSDVDDPLVALPINALLPLRLARICAVGGARLIHFSTDCVFDGRDGGYTESSASNAEDLYGKSKYLGEVGDKAHVLTVRTSIIGHELNSANSLVDWFLSQQGQVRGFTRALFSGLPTVEIARVLNDFVLPSTLSGLYHLSVDSISKYDLLTIVRDRYGADIEIVPDDSVRVDRSLDSSRFQAATGYVPPDWTMLVKSMHENFQTYGRET